MSPFEFVSATQAYRERCEDRVAIFAHDSRIVVVIADGAGGSGNGGCAALAVIHEIEAEYQHVHSANEWSVCLRQIDCRIGNGETTVVVVDIRTIGIAGASVGDSRAIIVKGETICELTAGQKRKPLIGTGKAEPIGFVSAPLDGLLLLGTDGLFSYAKPNAILATIAKSDFQTLPRKCIDMVRLSSGEYWDDVGVVAVRNRPLSSTRRRFTVE